MNVTRDIIRTALLFCLIVCPPSLGIAQWNNQKIPGEVGLLLTVDFSDSVHGASSGYGFGFGGRAIYTNDGGIHWEMATVPDTSRSLVTLQMINVDTGFIAGAYNVPAGSALSPSPVRKLSARQTLAHGVERYMQKIGRTPGQQYRALFLRTTDGGKTWQDYGVLPDSMGYLIGASFVDARTGYVTGDGLESFTNVAILKTTDGGSHWIRHLVSDSVSTLRNIRASDADHAVAVGYTQRGTITRGVIISTSNGGVTWKEQTFPTVDNFTDVFFSDAATGYAVGVSTNYHGVVLKTTNTGETWEQQYVSPDTMLLDVVRFLPGTNEGLLVGERILRDTNSTQNPKPFVGRTTDGGATWLEESLPDTPPWTLLVGADMLSHRQAYLSGGTGSLGAMVRFENGTVGIEPAAGKPPTSFSLSQNFPNPFNPLTTIKYTVGVTSGRGQVAREAGNGGWGVGNGVITLKVYDLLGREVAVLVNDQKTPGSYEVRLDGSGLASGVYFYRLASGNYVETKKLFLLR